MYRHILILHHTLFQVSVGKVLDNALSLCCLKHRFLKDVLLLLKIIDVWLDLLEQYQTQSKKRFAIEVFFHVFGTFDDIQVEMNIDLWLRLLFFLAVDQRWIISNQLVDKICE